MNGKVRFEGEVAGCLYQIEPYLLRLLYALHLPPQTSRFTILKILFRENRKHVVLYIVLYYIHCNRISLFQILKKNAKTKNHKMVISVHDFI